MITHETENVYSTLVGHPYSFAQEKMDLAYTYVVFTPTLKITFLDLFACNSKTLAVKCYKRMHNIKLVPAYDAITQLWQWLSYMVENKRLSVEPRRHMTIDEYKKIWNGEY